MFKEKEALDLAQDNSFCFVEGVICFFNSSNNNLVVLFENRG
jgi:hypothetical protein